MFITKRLSPIRTLFHPPPSPYAFRISQCSTSSLSHLTYSHAHSERVSVWWDMDSCNVPLGLNHFKVAKAIAAAIRSMGIKARIQITAHGTLYGPDREALKLTESNVHALAVTGIQTFHVPHDRQEVALNTSIKSWVAKNPPPANVFIISDATNLAPVLSFLENQQYNVFVVKKQPGIWCWESLVRGGSSAGRVFSEVSFWPAIETLLNTAIGSFILKESKSREILGYYLQKCAPKALNLKSASESDLLLMVDTLIKQKKWVVEKAHLVRPFSLAKSAKATS